MEKRLLQRIGHVFRMRNERLTKAIVLGWWEELERLEKRSEKKMILHCKRILREAGIAWTDVKRLTREKADHVERWERLTEHRFEWGEGGGGGDSEERGDWYRNWIKCVGMRGVARYVTTREVWLCTRR